MLRDPQEFIKCPRCGGKGEIQDVEYELEMITCDLCEGSGEIHPDDDEEEPDPDWKYESEKDR